METRTLGDIITFERGLTYSKGDEVVFSSIGVLRSNNVDLVSHKLNLEEIKYLRSNFDVPPKKRVKKDTLLMCMSNGSKEHLGKVALIDRDMDYAFGGFMGLLTPNTDKVFPKYLFYALISEPFKKYISGLSDGANINNLKYGDLSEFVVVLPSLSEQQRIVDILDKEFAKIDELKSNAEQNLKNAKDLFQAALKKELEPKEGWDTYTLEEACLESGQYGMSVSSKQFDGIRYLRITDITEEGDLNNDVVSADIDEIEEKYLLQTGDILFARTGATVGKTLVYEQSMGKCSYAGYLIRYRPITKIVLPRTLYYITHSAAYYKWVLDSQRQSTLPNISAKLYNSYSITVPNPSEQELIVIKLDDLNTKCKVLQDNYTKTIALCDDLKQSLLRKAFNGEL